MHDIGRTQLEHSAPYAELSESGRRDGFGELGELGEYGEVAELGELGEFESSGEFESAGEYESAPHGSASPVAESPLHETLEMDLASRLLEVSSEYELEQFLGDVFRAVGSAAGNFVRSDTGRALGGILRDNLKSAAKQALPVVGRALGGYISPGGGDFGARAGAAAGDLLGLELEGLSSQDQEFEVARQLVRFTSSAINQAARAPQYLPADLVARTAARRAARTYAPGLLPRLQGRSGRLWPHSGRWVRRGRTIVLYGM